MIERNLKYIKERIKQVCLKVKRDPQGITIVAVTKGVERSEIEEVLRGGITDIGENRIQEAVIKYNNLRLTKFHMVGHLQTNKVKEAVRIFSLIHSVDSLRIAQYIDKEAAKVNKIQDVLIQVNTSIEASKFGLKPDETLEAVEKIKEFKNINLKGLMTIAPLVDDQEETRPYFRILRELRDRINDLSGLKYRLSTLSMGMSGDFEIAIEEGSNMIRLGRAIFKN